MVSCRPIKTVPSREENPVTKQSRPWSDAIYVASNQGLHCLALTLLRVSRSEWVKYFVQHTINLNCTTENKRHLLLHRFIFSTLNNESLWNNCDSVYLLDLATLSNSSFFLMAWEFEEPWKRRTTHGRASLILYFSSYKTPSFFIPKQSQRSRSIL